jgi:hypothetical protein
VSSSAVAAAFQTAMSTQGSRSSSSSGLAQKDVKTICAALDTNSKGEVHVRDLLELLFGDAVAE